MEFQLVSNPEEIMVDMGEGPSHTALVFVGHCSECRKRFYTPYPTKRTCGPECSKERQKRLKRQAYAQDPGKQIERVQNYQQSDKGKATLEKSKERNRQTQAAWWDQHRDAVNARRREKYQREKSNGNRN